jgi:lysylphosphatidylglycerol synthetase-like protein (DUF2156 family)
MAYAPTTTILGIEVPSGDPLFVAVVGIHILAGLTCVVAGAVAMLSVKRGGRHPRFGSIYYRSLTVVFATATVLSALRWDEKYHLFVLGVLAFAAGSLGRMAMRRKWASRFALHILGMGLSYVLLLTAFYVDNGKRLPLWKELPQWAFWVLPVAIGIPIIVRALLRYSFKRHPV